MPDHIISDPAKLRRVLQAMLLIEGDLDLGVLLRHVVAEACAITGARYGALGVLNSEGTALSEFITVGLDAEEERRIGARPTGRGVLGLLISNPQPLRLSSIASHPDSYGFPPGHPSMTSFLGVPLKVRDEVYGNLYLTDKIGWSEFTEDDVALVEALSLAAGIAIENARLHQRVREVAVYEDRDRLARDLHDTVIQQLFAVGLSLQAMAGDAAAAQMKDRLSRIISDIDETIRQLRSAIYELASPLGEQGLRASLLALVNDLTPLLGFEATVIFDGPVDSAVSDQVAQHVKAAVREALTNVGRHAQASRATVSLSVRHGICQLQVTDNGRGTQYPLGEPALGEGLGLANLRRRAEKHGGTLTVASAGDRGTMLTWQVPIGE